MDCDFANARLTCPRCGFRAGERSWRRNCSGTGSPNGLGMLVEKTLAALGLTKGLYAHLRGRKRVVGGMHCVLVDLPDNEPSCNCDQRRAWLDRWGQSLINRWWP